MTGTIDDVGARPATGRRQVGRSLPAPDTEAVLRGEARYVADLRIPGCLDAAFTRSWAAHGALRHADAAPARTVDGVVAAWTAADLPDLPAVPGPPRSGYPAAMNRPALATGRVRFVGDPVAVVVATDRYRAEDGADLVEVDIDPLPAVLDPVAAAAEDAPRLYSGLSNVASERQLGEPCADELARCPVVVETTVRNQRLAATSMETRGILARPEPSGGLTVWCSHQAPHRLRAALAGAFGLDPAAVRVVVPAVGGAFGAKSQTYPEYLVVVAAALRLGRPVRWIEDRYEALTAGTHGRGQVSTLRLGLAPDGRFRALQVEIWADVGAYPGTGDFIPALTAWVLSGPYAIPRLHVTTRSVVTAAAPTASYRGAGRPEAAYALERCVDAAAERLGLDPAEIRRRNFVPADAFPYTAATGAEYDSGRYASALDAALAAADYAGWRAEQRRRRAAGDRRQLGIGIASWLERSGGEAGSSEYAKVELTGSGSVLARTGTVSQGQGHRTTLAQVVAEGLGVEPGQVQVVAGDTAEVAQGTGAFGSRSMQVGGNAAYLAAVALRDRAVALAAPLLGVPAGEVELTDRGLHPAGAPDRGITFAELTARVGEVSAEEVFAPPQAFPFGAYVAVVEVDRRTGDIAVLRLVAVDDCGVVVNPAVVQGQIRGSIAQGLGQALYEVASYGPDGQPLAGTLLDYTIPTAAEIPPITLVEHVTPNPNVPLGTKGTGESGCIGTPPAVVNAVSDALAGYDRSTLDMPLTPATVWACLQRPTTAGQPR
jgi:carbon-monoxide dehydrogenase large subunit